MKRKNGAARQPRKRVYRTPELKVHGDLRTLTLTKGGTNSDGSGKPATRTTTSGTS
jgi:hypothetical protein